MTHEERDEVVGDRKRQADDDRVEDDLQSEREQDDRRRTPNSRMLTPRSWASAALWETLEARLAESAFSLSTFSASGATGLGSDSTWLGRCSCEVWCSWSSPGTP